MKKLILLSLIVLVSCDTQKKCARFVSRHPECFRDSIVRDTTLVQHEVHDTLLQFVHDTLPIYVKTPCGDVKITKTKEGKLRAKQKPFTKTVRDVVYRNLPCSCNCDSLKSQNKRLRKELRKLKNRSYFHRLTSNIRGVIIPILILLILGFIRKWF